MKPEQYKIMFELEDNHWWYSGMRQITDAILSQIHTNGHPLSILDAGCGTGAELAHLEKYGKVTGLDISEYALSFCTKRGQLNALNASITELHFKDNSFDLVTSFDVIYHLWVEEDRRALREMWRVLKPGGRLLLRVSAYQFLTGPHDQAVYTRERYTSKKVATRLRDAGFTIEKLTYANTLLFPLAGAVRLLARFGIGKRQSALKSSSGPVNKALRHVLAIEAGLISRMDLPFGLSIICLARKNEQSS